MPFLTKRGLILAKAETTYGTDAVPTPAANAILARNVSVTVYGQMLTRDFLRSNLSRLSAIVGRKLMTITFETEIRGSGTAGTAPRHGVLHRMCGMSVTNVPATSDTYAPIDSAFESGDVYFYNDGMLYKCTGAYADCRIRESAGQFGVFQWTVKGIFNLPIDAAIPGGITFDATVPPMIQSLAAAFGGYSPIAQNLEIDLGIEIQERLDLNSAEGFKGLSLTGRAVGGSIDPEQVAEATHSFWTNFKNGTEVALAGNLIGATAGNKVAITGPKIQYEAPGPGDRNGFRTYQIPIRFNPSTLTASDEISIAYT